MSRKINEECGIFGIYNKSGIKQLGNLVYFGLFALQHRGQEAAGIAINRDGDVVIQKSLGLVSDVFKDSPMISMDGDIAVGHVRYSTTGSNTQENAQPLCAKYYKGSLTIAHNGNICNADKLRKELSEQGSIFHSTNDSEIIAYLIAKARIHTKSIEEAVKAVIPMLEGSFSLLVMSPRKLIAVRDPHGIRPLCMGKIKDSVIFASESCALDTVGATFVRDIRPGEIAVVNQNEQFSIEDYCNQPSALCIFEHIYFARPDSVIDGQSVNEARVEAGKMLAKQHPVEADVVIGVPDSGLSSAIGYSIESGIPYGVGLIKNRYIGRTFIQPSQAMRERSVALKLNVLKANIDGKRVIVIDDSIVRGTTLANIIKMLKKGGATEVHVRISSPKFIYPCFFGTDIPDRSQLASVNYTHDELCRKIGADSLGFLDTDSVDEIAKNSKLAFCKACFTGKYPCPVPESVNKTEFE